MVRTRPLWFIDAKWVAGIICVLVLHAYLLLVALGGLAGPQVSVAIGTAIFSELLGDAVQSNFDNIQRWAKVNPGRSLAAMGLPEVGLTGKDVSSLTAEQLTARIAEGLARALVQGQLDLNDLELLGPDAGAMMPLALLTGALGFIGTDASRILSRAALVPLPLLAIFAILLLVFSYRFGKLVSPGVATLCAALPGFVLGRVLSLGARALGDDPIGTTARAVVASVGRPFNLAVSIGAGLVVLGIAGSLVFRPKQGSTIQAASPPEA